jgi:hypothetical protein
MISSLEAGKYYVQISALSAQFADEVHLELSRIDPSLPRAIMRAESPVHGEVYQILIGPLNLGESGAILNLFRSTHSGAFIRPWPHRAR